MLAALSLLVGDILRETVAAIAGEKVISERVGDRRREKCVGLLENQRLRALVIERRGGGCITGCGRILGRALYLVALVAVAQWLFK